jgi:hypothetical protein
MKNVTRHYGKLEIIRREQSSINGNPRYLLRVDGYLCVTTPDSSMAYSLPNLDGKQVEALIGTHYGKTSLGSAWLAD